MANPRSSPPRVCACPDGKRIEELVGLEDQFRKGRRFGGLTRAWFAHRSISSTPFCLNIPALFRGDRPDHAPPCQNRSMLRVGTVVVGVDDVRRASEFWRAALGYVPRDGELEPDDDFVVLVPSDGAGTALALDTSESPVQEHPRVHIDLYVDTAAEQEAEVERLVSLGAQRVDWDLYPESPDFIVLADTEGNRFCVVDKSHG